MAHEEQLTAITLINQHLHHLTMTDIHAHIGTQVNDTGAYQKEAEFLIAYAQEVSELLPYGADLLPRQPFEISKGDKGVKTLLFIRQS